MRKLAIIAILAVAGCGSKVQVVPSTPIAWQELPHEVKEAVGQRFPGMNVAAAWRTPNGDYDVSLRLKSGKTREMLVSASGEVLEAE